MGETSISDSHEGMQATQLYLWQKKVVDHAMRTTKDMYGPMLDDVSTDA